MHLLVHGFHSRLTRGVFLSPALCQVISLNPADVSHLKAYLDFLQQHRPGATADIEATISMFTDARTTLKSKRNKGWGTPSGDGRS